MLFAYLVIQYLQLLYVMLINPFIEKLSEETLVPNSNKLLHFSMKKKLKDGVVKDNQKTIKIKILHESSKQGSGMISSVSYSDGIIEIKKMYPK